VGRVVLSVGGGEKNLVKNGQTCISRGIERKRGTFGSGAPGGDVQFRTRGEEGERLGGWELKREGCRIGGGRYLFWESPKRGWGVSGNKGEREMQNLELLWKGGGKRELTNQRTGEGRSPDACERRGVRQRKHGDRRLTGKGKKVGVRKREHLRNRKIKRTGAQNLFSQRWQKINWGGGN